jgi:hypothetical protein
LKPPIALTPAIDCLRKVRTSRNAANPSGYKPPRPLPIEPSVLCRPVGCRAANEIGAAPRPVDLSTKTAVRDCYGDNPNRTFRWQEGLLSAIAIGDAAVCVT